MINPSKVTGLDRRCPICFQGLWLWTFSDYVGRHGKMQVKNFLKCYKPTARNEAGIHCPLSSLALRIPDDWVDKLLKKAGEA